MATTQMKVEMKLLSVIEEKFSMSSDKINAMANVNELQISFTNRVINDELANDKISLVFGVRYSVSDNTLLECSYRFNFAVKEAKKFVQLNLDGTATINVIIPPMLNVAVGTMRGILVVKTAGSPLSRFVIPMIDEKALAQNLSKK